MSVQSEGAAPGRYRHYVLGVLLTVYTFNYLDRQIVAILLPALKVEFALSDTQLGLLSGFAFAVFYATLGIPIAVLADRVSRKWIVAASLSIWSAMTVLSGTAGSFAQLLMYRVFVGVGEAGGSPPAHSIISDYYKPRERGTALGIYSLGIPIGLLLGMVIGGQILEHYGWRMAFYVAGIPGLLIALLLALTVKEPRRGAAEDTPVANLGTAPRLMETIRFMMGNRALVHIFAASTLNAFVGYGFIAWVPTFFVRDHGMSPGELSIWLGLIIGIFGGLGTFAGGYFADRLAARRGEGWRAYVIAIPLLLSLPFGIGLFFVGDATLALLLFIPPAFIGSLFVGPALSVVQGSVSVQMRAVASAFYFFVLNFIALGGGPFTIGFLSDLLVPVYETDALRYAMLAVAFVNIWALLHYVLAGRALARQAKAA